MQAIRLFIRRLTDWPYESDDDQDRVTNYLERALEERDPAEPEERDPAKPDRRHLLTLLLRAHGLGEGALDRFAEPELGEFDRVKGIVLEFANLYSSDCPEDRDRHDDYLRVYEEHPDTRGWCHEVAVEPAALDGRTAAPCDEPSEDSDAATSPVRLSVDECLAVLASLAEDETPEGRRIIQSIGILLGMPPEELKEVLKKKKLFLGNGRFNRSGLRHLLDPAPPDHHTIKRVLNRIQSGARRALQAVRAAATPPIQANPDLTLGVPRP